MPTNDIGRETQFLKWTSWGLEFKRGECKYLVPVLKFSNNTSPAKWIMLHFHDMAETGEAFMHSFVYVILLGHSVIPWCPLYQLMGVIKKKNWKRLLSLGYLGHSSFRLKADIILLI